jgi:glycosyltransferase involved in cell wall biosynthesis
MGRTMPEVSVIICTHNPKLDYLRRTLDALRAQTLSADRWELLLVDNGSKPPLEPALISWHPNARYIVENELGLAPARRRGIQEASAGLLVFVDDDNLLDPSYLSEALAISQDWVRLGAFGSGSIVPEFERQPQKYLEKFTHFLTLRQNNKDFWTNMLPTLAATTWGAGLCVRAEVARAYCELSNKSSFKIRDRQGGNLVRRLVRQVVPLPCGGQDMEVGYFACSLGLGVGSFTRLKVTHLIRKERVQEEYLLRMVEGQELAWALLDYKWLGVIPKSPFSPRRLLSLANVTLFSRRFDRRARFAYVRATIEARHIILTNRDEMSKTTGVRFDVAPEI